MADHIKSKKGNAVTKYKPNTDRYDNIVGLYRMIFQTNEEPKAMVTIVGKSGAEFWVQVEEDKWEKKF